MEGGLRGTHEVGPSQRDEVEKASSGAGNVLGTAVCALACRFLDLEDLGMRFFLRSDVP